LRYPRPDFCRPLHVSAAAELPDTSDLWADHGEIIALTMPNLFLGGIASDAMEVRLVQGLLDESGGLVALHASTAVELAGSNALNSVLQTVAGFQWGRLQIKTTTATTATLQLTGVAHS